MLFWGPQNKDYGILGSILLGSPYLGKLASRISRNGHTLAGPGNLESRLIAPRTHMSFNLNPLKGGYVRDYVGTTVGVIKGDTRS